MAQFTKQVPFTAYRFMPAELTVFEQDYPEDVLLKELDYEVHKAQIGDDGNLHVHYYVQGYFHEGREYVEVKPGEWLVAPEMKVFTDEEFRKFATRA